MTNDAALTRRRCDNPHEETCYFTDVSVGTIGPRAGVPINGDGQASAFTTTADHT
ncbi:hypothetical protein AB4Z51_42680 [Bradyrhizobium sp. 2TAF36]|uniref:hypothetical protein n=1 Tax=unclassified Bradyrhizobium TaxID=2631580 RepID=UPI00143167AA|nr:hypothetical protein [Bradyrhizobium sp. MOS001]